MSFNLNDYETVKQRKKRFYLDHPEGRILVQIINTDIEKQAFFKATIYKNREDQEKNLPWSSGHAYEWRETELSMDRHGKSYESVNYSSWTENCEESAIGRALDNAGYAGNDKCSREEMQKVAAKTIKPIFGFCGECQSPILFSEKKMWLYCSNFRNCKAQGKRYNDEKPLDASIKNYDDWIRSKKAEPKRDQDIPF